jgi:hypothetical protein
MRRNAWNGLAMSAALAAIVRTGFVLYQRIARTPAVPVLMGAVLFVAAMLKGHQAATEDIFASSILTSRGFVVASVLFELGLGLWLISGFYERFARWVGVVTFVGFLEVSLYLHLLDAPTCGCFGRINILPWQAMLIDLACIGLLLAWQPAGGLTVRTHPRWLGLLGFAYATIAALAVVSIVHYAPTGPMPSLRNDPMLLTKVPLDLENATLPDVLEKLHKATGLTFSVSEAVEVPEDLGNVKTERAQAWAVLEWLAGKHAWPARWEPTADGYRLVRAAPLGLTFPWAFSGLVFALVTMAAVVIRMRQALGEQRG